MSQSGQAKQISQGVTRSCIARAKLGKWCSGSTPFGYIVGGDGKLAPGDPAEIEAVVFMFEQYLARDIGLKRLAGECNKRGFPVTQRTRSRGWTDDAVHNILTNVHYTGVFTYNEKSQGKYHRIVKGEVTSWRPPKLKCGKPKPVENDPESEIRIEDNHPALVHPDVYRAVQSKLAAHQRGSSKRHQRKEWLFSGLLECGDCKRNLRGCEVVKKSSSGRRITYRRYLCGTYMGTGKTECHFNAVDESTILDRVVETVHQAMADEKSIADLRKRLEREQGRTARDAKKDARKLRERIEQLGRMIDGGLDKLATLDDLAEPMKVKIRQWQQERRDLSADLDRLERIASAGEQERSEIEEALASLGRLGEIIRAADPPTAGNFLRKLIVRVELHFDHVPLKSGRVRSICTGGHIHLRPLLQCVLPWSTDCETRPALPDSGASGSGAVRSVDRDR
jgi:hypothetical protein